MRKEELTLLYKKFLSPETSDRDRALILTILQDCDEQDLPNFEDVLNSENRNIVLNDHKSDEIFTSITGEKLYPAVKPIWKRKVFLRAAAALIITGFSILFYLNNTGIISPNHNKPESNFENTTKFVKQIKLNDGSTISLKQGAKLLVLSDFTKDTIRRVQLIGEAFFEISKNPKKAFVVENSGAFDVRVLGTAFNLINTPYKNLLVLNHGKVQVKNGLKQVIILPGQKAAFDKTKQSFEVAPTDTVESSNWINNLLAFDREPIQKIFSDLNSLYPEQRLRLNEKFEAEIFTGYLPSNDLDKSLEILNRAFNTTIIYKHQ